MFFPDLINLMVGKVPCLLKMRCQQKNRNSRKNHSGKWSEKSLFEMLGVCNFLCILKIFLGCFSLSYAKRSILEAWYLKNTIKITKIQRFTTFKVWGFFRPRRPKERGDQAIQRAMNKLLIPSRSGKVWISRFFKKT